MNIHKNARLMPLSRAELVRRGFWPILIQTIYGVQDVELPSASPFVATGLRIAIRTSVGSVG